MLSWSIGIFRSTNKSGRVIIVPVKREIVILLIFESIFEKTRKIKSIMCANYPFLI